MKVIRVWLYRAYERLMTEDATPSKTNVPVVKEVYGEFKYFVVYKDGTIRPSSRKEARNWVKEFEQPIETFRDYPAFMKEQGYKV